MGSCFKSYLSYEFDWPETVHDRVKINLARHVSRDSSEIISSPVSEKTIWVFSTVV